MVRYRALAGFAREAYNVEQGVTNELFPNERQGDPSCQYATHPEDRTDIGSTSLAAPSDVVLFAKFMGLLAAPVPASFYGGWPTGVYKGRLRSLPHSPAHHGALGPARLKLRGLLSL